jgi:MFS family permease
MIRTPSNRIALGFAQAGHSYSHLFMLLYPTVVIALERELGLSYGELLILMTAGNVLFGVGALPAGWLGDRWSATGMMCVMYVGMGAGAIVTGLVSSQLGLALGLALIGLFASIYHPVGTSLVVRTATNRGRALGLNGVFGSLGVASAGLVAGVLTDLVSWRAAFIVPGVISLGTGVALVVLWRLGMVADTRVDASPQPEPSRRAMVRAFIVLGVTMVCAGIMAQCFMVALPKIFAARLPEVTGGTATGAGALVSVVYVAGMGAQLVGGHLADRYSLRATYALIYAVQIPLLVIAAGIGGWALFACASAATLMHSLAVPVENSLLSRYSPGRWRATAFGAKFVLAIGVAALGVPLVAYIYDTTGDFYWLFMALAALAGTVVLASLWLPRDEPRESVVMTAQKAVT